MMVLSISLWALFIGLFLSGILETANGFFVPAYYATAGIAPIFALGFALSYSVRNRKNSIIKRLFEIVVYTISCVAVVAFCFFPNWLLKSIDSTNLTVELGFHANVIYTVFFALICLLTAIFLTVNMIRTRRKAVKHGLKKVLIVWVIGGVLGSISNLLLPFFGDYSLIWVAPLLIMALMIPMSSTLVATVEHFSLPKTFFRGFIYFVFVSVSTFIIFSASQIVSYLDFASKSDIERFMKISVSLMVLTPIIFLLFWAMRKAVKKLDSDGFDENMVLTSMSHIVASKHTPSEFLAIVRHELVRFFGVRQADVIVFEHNTATHLKGNALKSALIRLTSGQKNQNKHHTIYCEDIKNKTDYAIIKSCDIEVIVPIVGAIDGNAVGAIVLSPRKRRYDRQYGETLERVSIIISPYIQSASFYEQILGYNDKLRADVRRKTQKLRLSYEELAEANERKSEALHTASHNLRTPLTGVNGMISMVLDGDTGKINKETQKYLEIALQSGQA
ncbi:MAG: hypothetical protein LBC86_00180, partial [Oscillospiraceae bacterium]|nr:hypothetical protein [Oscillospiraceae bacterium]